MLVRRALDSMEAVGNSIDPNPTTSVSAMSAFRAEQRTPAVDHRVHSNKTAN